LSSMFIVLEDDDGTLRTARDTEQMTLNSREDR
jgi:hypothetical protein